MPMAEDKIKGFSINRNGYGTIPKSVMQDQELTLASKAVYSYFCSFTGSGDTCFPSRSKICFDLGVSKDRLGKCLSQLTERGYIRVEQVKNERGQFSHNLYTLPDIVFPCTENPDTVCPDTEKKDTKKNSSKTNNISKKNNSKSVWDSLKEAGYGLDYYDIHDLVKAIDKFVEFRKGIKKPMTDYAIELMVKKLYEFTKGNICDSVDILEQSIMNGWQGIFPLKENKGNSVSNAIKNRVSNVDNW